MAYGGKVVVSTDAFSSVISTERSERRNLLQPLLIPMIDARRMEVYAAIFDENCNKIKDTEAVIIDVNSFSDLKKDHHLYMFGDGADKCSEIFENDDKITVIKDFYCSARYMNVIAQRKLDNRDFVDVAYFEPFYLKDFVPGTPTVKGLH